MGVIRPAIVAARDPVEPSRIGIAAIPKTHDSPHGSRSLREISR
jgi:hypothetical protein